MNPVANRWTVGAPPRLLKLVVKPHMECTHQCPYCVSRKRTFHNSLSARLGVEDWVDVFRQADELGARSLTISGGEPTLYPPLDALVWEAKRLGWYVSVNSNGSHLFANLAQRLRAVCLDQVVISLMSLSAGLHDSLRNTPGSWRAAVAAIDQVRKVGISWTLHVIVNRHNYSELPEIIDFAFAKNADRLILAYPENDMERMQLLMSDHDLKAFRTHILPAARERFAAQFGGNPSGAAAESLARLSMYEDVSPHFGQGLYWQDRKDTLSGCTLPQSFAIIYQNGDVLPCNGVEYTGEPLMGNVRQHDLGTIFRSELFARFRTERMSYCMQCPVPKHVGIGIMSQRNPYMSFDGTSAVPSDLPLSRPCVSSVYQHVSEETTG